MRRSSLLAVLVVPVTAVAFSLSAGRETPAERMTEAAQSWLDSLSPALLEKGRFEFADAERQNWHFVPQQYPGVSLGEMTLEQRRCAHALLRSALSSRGYLKTTTIMLLEQVLRDAAEREGRQAEHRDPERYWFAVFGKPSTDEPWGWRVQGHHVSLNFSLVGDGVNATTPSFLGANPAEVRDGPHAGLRALGAEEDLARELLSLLDAKQRARALIQDRAPRDIVLAPGKKLELLGKPEGLPVSAMTPDQRAVLEELIEEYANNLRPATAELQLSRIRAAGLDDVHFAWAGSTEPGQGHYYRIHGPVFAIEYDNTQNDANHVHTVWHDLENDFSAEWLREHYEKHRHPR